MTWNLVQIRKTQDSKHWMASFYYLGHLWRWQNPILFTNTLRNGILGNGVPDYNIIIIINVALFTTSLIQESCHFTFLMESRWWHYFKLKHLVLVLSSEDVKISVSVPCPCIYRFVPFFWAKTAKSFRKNSLVLIFLLLAIREIKYPIKLLYCVFYLAITLHCSQAWL